MCETLSSVSNASLKTEEEENEEEEKRRERGEEEGRLLLDFKIITSLPGPSCQPELPLGTLFLPKQSHVHSQSLLPIPDQCLIPSGRSLDTLPSVTACRAVLPASTLSKYFPGICHGRLKAPKHRVLFQLQNDFTF